MTRDEYDAVRDFVVNAAGSGDIERVIGQDKSVDLGDGFEARMCRYLDMENQSCAVYEARPLVCRLLGHVEWLPCPIEKIERTAKTADAIALMQAYSTEERLTFEQWDDRSGGEYAYLNVDAESRGQVG